LIPYIKKLYGIKKNRVPRTRVRSICSETNRYAAKNGKAVFTQETGLELQNRDVNAFTF
jgi:hypothetical protein